MKNITISADLAIAIHSVLAQLPAGQVARIMVDLTDEINAASEHEPPAQQGSINLDPETYDPITPEG